MQTSSVFISPHNIEYYTILDSTHREAIRRIHMHQTTPVVLTCDVQSAGIGTHGRKWHGADGNLFASCIAKYEITDQYIGILSLLVGIAIFEVLDNSKKDPQDHLSLKWPNDILCNGRKTAGILLETVQNDSRSNMIVISFGINLAHTPPEVESIATFIRCIHSKQEILQMIITRINHWYSLYLSGGFEKIRWFWLSHLHTGCDNITEEEKESSHAAYKYLVRQDGREYKCRFADIDIFGRALLLTKDDMLIKISNSEALVLEGDRK